MKGDLSIPPLRDLPPGRLAQRSEHLLFEITRERESRGVLPRLWPSRWGRPSRRRLMLVLAAAALVVVIGTASAFGVRVFFLDKGFIGLPPEGATPSSPENAELVLFYWGPVPGDWGKSRFWVYADGRLISLREANRPEGANPHSTGYLEQRLTPNGVELLRSEIVSIGLIGDELGDPIDTDDDFAIGSDAIPSETTEPVPSYSMLQVRDGDQLYRVSRVGDLDRLVARLTDPASSLPASAWEVRKIRAYVPSRYAVCFAEAGSPVPIEPSYIMPLLPEPAQVLLRTREFAPAPWGGPPCTDLTTEEARALGEALNAAGLEPFKGRRIAPYVLTYRLETPGPIRVILFEPYLPSGEIPCSACG
jgi:hypothetical protein